MSSYGMMLENTYYRMTKANSIESMARIGFKFWVKKDGHEINRAGIQEFISECVDILDETHSDSHKHSIDEAIEWAANHFVYSYCHLIKDKASISSKEMEIACRTVVNLLENSHIMVGK